MMSNIIVNQELSEQTSPMVSSRLYHIPLVELGTINVERQTSYIIRLAREHHVDPYALIAFEIVPRLDRAYLYLNGRHVHDNFGASWWKGISVSLNGLNSLTEVWVKTLEHLTCYTNLRFSTLLTYRNVLPYRNLIRKTHAWCPECYEEQRLTGELIYDPLLWSLEVITTCVKHQRKLQLFCPFSECGKSLLALSPHAQIGFCPFCNRWLGTELRCPLDIPSEEELNRQAFITSAAGEMLALAPVLGAVPERERISQVIRRYIDEIFHGNATALARAWGLHYSSVYAIRDGVQLPQFETLLKFCQMVGITPIQIFTQDVSTLSLQEPVEPDGPSAPKRNNRAHRRFDKEKVRNLLLMYLHDDKMPPKSMAEVARALDYDLSFLEKHLPDECELISTRFAEFQAAQSAGRTARDCEKACQVTYTIHGQGLYPSRQRVYRYLGGSFRDEDVRKAYYDTMVDLGYKSNRSSSLLESQ